MNPYALRGAMDRAAPSIRLAKGLRAAGAWVVLALLRWQELAAQRRRLLSMNERMLKDIGITRADAAREGSRPFWDTRGVDWTSWR